MKKVITFLFNTVCWVDEHKLYGAFIVFVCTLSLAMSSLCFSDDKDLKKRIENQNFEFLKTKDSITCNLDEINSRLGAIEASNKIQLEWLKSIYYKEH